MPGRLLPLVTGEIYHVFNRGIDHRPTFTSVGEYKRALITIKFYRFSSQPVKLSRFLILSGEEKGKFFSDVKREEKFLVEFLSFCLMPNHFHFLIKQVQDGGISRFMSNFQNSFTRYFNVKHERTGQLFLNQFKAVRIETDEQFLHVSRYIHLNPHSSFIVKNLSDLENYQWSSLFEHIGDSKDGISNSETILSFFKDKQNYKGFVFDQANYQRELDKIKHLVIDSDT